LITPRNRPVVRVDQRRPAQHQVGRPDPVRVRRLRQALHLARVLGRDLGMRGAGEDQPDGDQSGGEAAHDRAFVAYAARARHCAAQPLPRTRSSAPPRRHM
jgi:hypothetical protein